MNLISNCFVELIKTAHMRDARQATYFNAGRNAHRAGMDRKTNPYNLKTDKGHLWDEGWISQDNVNN